MPGIVSLLPSGTEWVYALGVQDELAGVTFECDHPPGVRERHPVVVRGLDTGALGPAEIDALVRSRVAEGGPLYVLDESALSRVAPDVVLTQDLCQVCALPAGEVNAALDRVGRPARVVTLDPHRLPDVVEGAVRVAEAAGVPERGRRLDADLRTRLDRVATAVRHLDRPRVLVLEWTDPPFLAGHWVPDLIEAAGGVPVLAEPGGRSTPTTWEVVAGSDPGMVLIAPCGFGLPEAELHMRDVLDRLPPGAAVWAIDAGAYVTRPGPRVVDAVETLASALHPDAVPAPPPGRVSRVR